jgi:AraC-like DNA-binding protein
MTKIPHPAEPQQPRRFSSEDFATPQMALQKLREIAADICDVTVVGQISDFCYSSIMLQLCGAVLFEARTSALRYDRGPSHVARGLDHFQLTIYLAGGAEHVAGDRIFLQRTGDICLLDVSAPSLTREMQAEDGAAQLLCFLLPRMLLAPLLASAERGPTIRILPRETPYSGMLTDHMLSLRRHAAKLTISESQASIQSLVQLIGGCVADDRDEGEAESASRENLRARVALHIENNLGAPSLSVDALRRRFGLSRATLYRLFEPQSPASYIQQRRLHRAFAMLISPAFRKWRVLDIALECHFSSDATFIRAFRRQFGITPGEARTGREARGTGSRKRSCASGPLPDAEAIRRITQLTGVLLPGRYEESLNS